MRKNQKTAIQLKKKATVVLRSLVPEIRLWLIYKRMHHHMKNKRKKLKSYETEKLQFLIDPKVALNENQAVMTRDGIHRTMMAITRIDAFGCSGG